MAEMLVSILFITLILGATGATVVVGLRVSRDSVAGAANAQDAAVIMDQITTPLRMATEPPTKDPQLAPFGTGGTPRTGTSTDITFYSTMNPVGGGAVVDVPTKFRFYLDPGTGTLVKQVTPGRSNGTTTGWPASAMVSYSIGGGLSPDQSIFTYYAGADAPSTSVDDNDAFCITMVGVRLSLDKPTTAAGSSTVLAKKVDLPILHRPGQSPQKCSSG